MIQKVQKTVEVAQIQCIDRVAENVSKGLSNKTCEVLEKINKQSPDSAGSVHAGKDKMDDGAGDQGVYAELSRSLRSFAWKIYKFDCRELEEDSDESASTEESASTDKSCRELLAHGCDEAWWEAEKRDLEELSFYEKDFGKGLEEMTTSQLRTACLDLDLPDKGRRALLIDRLVEVAIQKVERRRMKRLEDLAEKRGEIQMDEDG